MVAPDNAGQFRHRSMRSDLGRASSRKVEVSSAKESHAPSTVDTSERGEQGDQFGAERAFESARDSARSPARRGASRSYRGAEKTRLQHDGKKLRAEAKALAAKVCGGALGDDASDGALDRLPAVPPPPPGAPVQGGPSVAKTSPQGAEASRTPSTKAQIGSNQASRSTGEQGPGSSPAPKVGFVPDTLPPPPPGATSGQMSGEQVFVSRRAQSTVSAPSQRSAIVEGLPSAAAILGAEGALSGSVVGSGRMADGSHRLLSPRCAISYRNKPALEPVTRGQRRQQARTALRERFEQRGVGQARQQKLEQMMTQLFGLL